ncbi:hypothetical protein [Virgisporangium ochraceum]|nr:hypothetical protein [Virgisporangium ochraceum]
MTEPPVRYLPGRPAVGLAATTVVTAGLVALLALGATLLSVRDLDPLGLLAVAVLGGSAQTARRAWVRLRTARRVRDQVPARLLRQRWHGDPTAAGADEYRALRPIGMARSDVVRRTEDLLRPLTDIPSVRIFRGVQVGGATRPAGAGDGAGRPRILAAFAVTAGRLVLVVEPVAWPPGRYLMDATGQLRCDGRFIGQSAGPLVSGVAALRDRLPRTHRVRALVVVHPIADGAVSLPVPTKEVAWTLARDLPTTMRTELARHPRTVSRHTVATLAVDG